MELRRLRYFVTLADERHFGRAAERLYVSQSALSQQIRVLERELGAELIDRSRRGVHLTSAGTALLVEAQELIRRSDRAVERVQAAARGLAGRLRLVYTRSSPELGHSLVNKFRLRFPDVEVATETAWTARNVEMLRADEVDVAFVRLPLFEATGLRTLSLVDSEVVLVMGSAHPLVSRDSLASGDLTGEALIEWPRAQAPGAYDDLHERLGVDWPKHVVREEPDAEHILAAVASGSGIALLDEPRGRRFIPDGVVVRRLADAPTSLHGLAWNSSEENSVAAQFVALAEREPHVRPPGELLGP